MNIKIIFAAVVCVSSNNKLSALQKSKIASGILIHQFNHMEFEHLPFYKFCLWIYKIFIRLCEILWNT